MSYYYIDRIMIGETSADFRAVESGDKEYQMVPGGTSSNPGAPEWWIYDGNSLDTDNGVDTLKPNIVSSGNPGRYKKLSVAPNITQSQPSRSLNSSYQLSTTHNAFATYSVSMAALLLAGASVFLEISPDNSTWQTVSQVGVSLGLTVTTTGCLYAFVPVSYYVRIRTTGTATVTLLNQQEALI